VVLQDGLRDKCSLAEHEIKQITAALDANNDGEVPFLTPAFRVMHYWSKMPLLSIAYKHRAVGNFHSPQCTEGLAQRCRTHVRGSVC
jgi:hypothetical protein